MANEWSGFKFWKKNRRRKSPAEIQSIGGSSPDIESDKLLEEYVDGLHFLLSIGVEYWRFYGSKRAVSETFVTKYFFIETPKDQFDSNKQKKNCIRLLKKIYRFGSTLTFESVEMVLDFYLKLGNALGYTGDEIIEGYKRKNQINRDRQHQNY